MPFTIYIQVHLVSPKTFTLRAINLVPDPLPKPPEPSFVHLHKSSLGRSLSPDTYLYMHLSSHQFPNSGALDMDPKYRILRIGPSKKKTPKSWKQPGTSTCSTPLASPSSSFPAQRRARRCSGCAAQSSALFWP